MPRELSWYLEELRKKHTPGHNPDNRFDVMYNTLKDLDDAIKDDDFQDEEKNKKVNDLYTRSIQAAQDYYNQRANAFFGPSDWELDTGLLGDLIRDLTAQRTVMRDMSDPQTSRRMQYDQFRTDFERNIREDVPLVMGKLDPERYESRAVWKNHAFTHNLLEDTLDYYGPTYDSNLDVPQGLKKELNAGNISTGRSGLPWSEGSFDTWRNEYLISRIPLRFEPVKKDDDDEDDMTDKERKEHEKRKQRWAEERKKNKEKLAGALFDMLHRIHNPEFGDPNFRNIILGTDFSKMTREQYDAFVEGKPQPEGEAGNDFLREPYIQDLVEQYMPFNGPQYRGFHRGEFRKAFLDICRAMQTEKQYIDDRHSQAGTRFFRYVEGQMVNAHGYFYPGDQSPQEAAKTAEKREKLQKALTELSKKIYQHPALMEFSDDSPEAMAQFVSGVQVPANQRYNSIETDESFLELVNDADPFYEDPNNINNINNDDLFGMPENDREEIPANEADSRVFRQAVFDMVTAYSRIRKDTQRYTAGTEEPEEYAAAASRLANGLGAGQRVEQVVRVRGTGRAGGKLYIKDPVEGEKPSGPNLIAPDKFAEEGAVLDSGEVARQIADIQALRYLTGTSAKGLGALRFAFSDDIPAQITGVTDVNMDGAFPFDADAEPMTPDMLTVMSRSMADRIMAISPERLEAILGSRISAGSLENAKNRLTALQQAIQESRDTKWAMEDSLLPGKLHVIEDETFSRLSLKQIAAVQENNETKGLFSESYSGMVLKGEQAAAENAAYPGGFYQRQMHALMESQGDKESSPEFTRALEAVKTLNTELNRYMKEDRELTLEEISALRKTYTECLVDVEKYVKASTHWYGWHWTTRGDVRHNAMAAIQGYMQQELTALNQYAPEHHWKLEKIIQHGRQEEIPVIEGDVEHVGANMNSRQVVTLNGRRGAFTPRTSYHEPTDEEIRAAFTNVDHLPEEYRAEVQAASAIVYQNYSVYIDGGNNFSPATKDNVGDIYEAADNNFLKRDEVKILNELLKDNGLPELNRNQDEHSRNFRRYLAETIRRGIKVRNYRGVMSGSGIEDGVNLDQRNTAMSVMSDLLEIPNATARARDARIVVNGQETEGTFQEWAEGDILGDQETTRDSDFTKYNSNAMTKEALQQLSDMQALDFICGNTDRHFNNMTFKFEDINGEHRLVKITGIDNDTSFGTIRMDDQDWAEETGKFVYPEHMLMMKQSTANAILNLRKDTLQVALRPYIHGPKELEACWDRVQGLQKQIRADMNYRFIGKYGLADGHIRIFRDDDPVWESFRPGDLAKSNSLMGQYAKFMQTAEMTKRRNRDPRPDDYEKRKSVLKGLEHTDYIRKLDAHPMLEVTEVNAVSSLMKQRKKKRPEIATYYRNMANVTLNDFADVPMNGLYMYQEAENALRDHFPDRKLNNVLTHDVLMEAGYRTSMDFFFVDGVPAEEYIRQNYPGLCQSQEFLDQPPQAQDQYLQGMMGALMTSGRHHIDMVIPAMDANGNFTAGITELKMDLNRLEGTEGKFGKSRKDRQDSLLADGTRETRFKEIEKKVTTKMRAAASSIRHKVFTGEEQPLREKYAELLQENLDQVNPPQGNQPVNPVQANQAQANQAQVNPVPVAPAQAAPGIANNLNAVNPPVNQPPIQRERIVLEELNPGKQEKKNLPGGKGKESIRNPQIGGNEEDKKDSVKSSHKKG